MSLHVVPDNDDRKHEINLQCWCEPLVIWIDPDTSLPWKGNGPLVRHRAADCREIAEDLCDDGESIAPDKTWHMVEA